MSVRIDGIKRLRANYYKNILIKEDYIYKDFYVSVNGDKINHETVSIGDRFGDDFGSKSDVEKIKELMEDYILHTKICGITDLVSVPGYDREQLFNVVYGNFGYRKMLLQLFNKDFKDILNKIQQKFYQDRFDFCYSEHGGKTFKISTCSTGSAYTIDLDKIHEGAKEAEYFKHISLRTKDFMLTDKEKDFIGEFIVDVFSKYGEEIQIEKVYNSEYEFARNKVVGYMFKCGDTKVYIDNCPSLLCILTMVGNYNLNLKYKKETAMKRQLVMEGF